MFAAHSGDMARVQLLLDAGANVTIRQTAGRWFTAMDYARDNREMWRAMFALASHRSALMQYCVKRKVCRRCAVEEGYTEASSYLNVSRGAHSLALSCRSAHWRSRSCASSA
jgi:hypothetical protein